MILRKKRDIVTLILSTITLVIFSITATSHAAVRPTQLDPAKIVKNFIKCSVTNNEPSNPNSDKNFKALADKQVSVGIQITPEKCSVSYTSKSCTVKIVGKEDVACYKNATRECPTVTRWTDSKPVTKTWGEVINKCLKDQSTEQSTDKSNGAKPKATEQKPETKASQNTEETKQQQDEDRGGDGAAQSQENASNADASNGPKGSEETKKPLFDKKIDKKNKEQVLKLQKTLNELNKGTGKIKEDGIWGKQTEHATKAFQKSQGLQADGAPGKNTTAKLNQAAQNQGTRNSPVTGITQKSTVGRAQAELNKLGYNSGKPDGKIGPNTRSAIEKFQKAHGLPATGKIDSETSDELTNTIRENNVRRAQAVSDNPSLAKGTLPNVDYTRPNIAKQQLDAQRSTITPLGIDIGKIKTALDDFSKHTNIGAKETIFTNAVENPTGSINTKKGSTGGHLYRQNYAGARGAFQMKPGTATDTLKWAKKNNPGAYTYLTNKYGSEKGVIAAFNGQVGKGDARAQNTYTSQALLANLHRAQIYDRVPKADTAIKRSILYNTGVGRYTSSKPSSRTNRNGYWSSVRTAINSPAGSVNTQRIGVKETRNYTTAYKQIYNAPSFTSNLPRIGRYQTWSNIYNVFQPQQAKTTITEWLKNKF